MKIFLHIILSSSLLYVGEYTTCLVLQFFVFALYKRVFYFLYLPLLHFALLKLFASLEYILYFTNLFLAIYTLDKENIYINKKERIFYILFVLFLYGGYIYFKDEIYDLYVWIDIIDKVHNIDSIVVYILTILHSLILFFVTFKKK